MTVQTHIIIRELEGKGASPELAAGIVETIAKMQVAGDVTKGDLLDMEKRLSEKFAAMSVDMEWLKKAIAGLYGFIAVGLLGSVAFLLQHYVFK